MPRRFYVLAAGLVLSAIASLAEVKIVQRPDGSTVIHNLGSPRRPAAPAAAAAVMPNHLRTTVEASARAQRLDPALVDAVIRVESDYDHRALSRKGAQGLMQLMPETARRLRITDPYDPAQNVSGGTAYLRRMLDRFDGDLELALAAYNAGPEAVAQYGGVPPYGETRQYVRKVMAIYRGDPSYALRGARAGRRTYLFRDAAGRLVMSTTPPAGG